MTPTPSSLLKMVLGNTYLLSALYLVVGVANEVMMRFFPSHFSARLSFALDALPSRALQLVGLFEPLRDAYFRGRMTDLELRVLLGVTTILIIFVLAFALGAVLAMLQRAATRRVN